MSQSSRHKSHKHGKYSSKEAKDKDCSDSEMDVKKKEKVSKDDSTRAYRDSATGEKHKILLQVRKGKDGKDLSCHGNGETLEEYVSSKRRKEKVYSNQERADVSGRVGGHRWDCTGEERGDNHSNLDIDKGESSKSDLKLKESSNKGENSRAEFKSKNRRYQNGSGEDSKEENVVTVAVEKDESKSKRESKRKSDRIPLEQREGKEMKDKERRLEKEKKGGQENKRADVELRAVDGDLGNNRVYQSENFSEDRQGKRSRESTEWLVHNDVRNQDLEKEPEKKVRRRREGFTGKDKCLDAEENAEKRLILRGDHSKDVKCSDERHIGGSYGDRYRVDGDKDDSHREDKHREDADKDNKSRDDKYREDSDNEFKRIDDVYQEDGNGDSRHRDEKYREGSDRDNRHRDDKSREGTERDGEHGNDKNYEDAKRDNRVWDGRYHEDTDKDGRESDGRYHGDGDGDRDYKQRDDSYREDSDRCNRHKKEKHWEDTETDSRHKDRRQGDDFDRKKRHRESKYSDECVSRDCSVDKVNKKHSRDDGYASDLLFRKSIMYDDGVGQDERTVRYRDDEGSRRSRDKEVYGNIRSRSTKDQKSDIEKKSASNARMDLVTDRGKSTSRNAEIELSSSHGRRRSSPSSSSHSTHDHYRLSNETKYREYAHDDKIQQNVTSTRDCAGTVGRAEKISSSRSLEKLGKKEDIHLGQLSAERHLKSDIWTSPLQPLYKSPSSSTDWRHLSRSNVRRTLDVEESEECSAGYKAAKEYSGKEGRGSRELAMDVIPGDELSRADGDALLTSSPFGRNSHLSTSSKSLPPHPTFRTGADSPSLGYAEGKSINRRRRIDDPNNGRVQGNAWRGVPNWPSPVANGFIPFPHGPPPIGFHSMMQQFPVPPIFGVGSSMELNHPRAPHHLSDADRFSGHGRPMGWRNPVGDSCPPLHGWNASNAGFGDESRMYERPNWDHARTLPDGSGWEMSGDLLKGVEMPSSTEKRNKPARAMDEGSGGQSIQHAQQEQSQRDQRAESADVSQLGDSVEMDAVESPHVSPEETGDLAKITGKDGAHFCHVYLSKLDISADLIEPELLNLCTSIIDMDQNVISDVDDTEILYIEEAGETKVVSSGKTISASLFPAANDSVFQKAMSHHKRRKEIFGVTNGDEPSLSNAKIESVPKPNQKEPSVEINKIVELASVSDPQDAGNDIPISDRKVILTNCSETVKGYSETLHLELGGSFIISMSEKLEEAAPGLESMPHEHITEKNFSMENEGPMLICLLG